MLSVAIATPVLLDSIDDSLAAVEEDVSAVQDTVLAVDAHEDELVGAVAQPGDFCDVGDHENNLGVYHPHPTDCGSFLQCDHRTLIVVSCPDDLVWNVDELTCDFSWNVACDAGNRGAW